MIVDVFLFNDEFDMLECRLYQLRGFVDRFIAIEADRTIAGAEKDFLLSERAALYPDVQVVKTSLADVSNVPTPPYTCVHRGQEHRWRRDWVQRNGAVSVLATMPADAIVLHGDIDEIPKRDVVIGLDGSSVVLELQPLVRSSRYYMPSPWYGTTVHTNDGFNAAKLRHERRNMRVIPDAGWHLTWFGDVNARIRKARAFAHGELERHAGVESSKGADVVNLFVAEFGMSSGGLRDWDGPLPAWIQEGHAPSSWEEEL